LVARAFLYFVVQVESIAHAHVGSGSSPIVGPFFLDKVLAFYFSPSPIGYTESFSLSLLRGSRSDAPHGPESPSHRYRYPSCLPRK
jgi:hypothetical protein